MSASLQALSRAKELIEEFSKLVSLLEPLTAPSNLATLKDAVIQKDMADKVIRLQQLF